MKNIWVKTWAQQHKIVQLSPTRSVISTFNTTAIRKIVSVGRKNENVNILSCIYNTDKEINFQIFSLIFYVSLDKLANGIFPFRDIKMESRNGQ